MVAQPGQRLEQAEEGVLGALLVTQEQLGQPDQGQRVRPVQPGNEVIDIEDRRDGRRRSRGPRDSRVSRIGRASVAGRHRSVHIANTLPELTC